LYTELSLKNLDFVELGEALGPRVDCRTTALVPNLEAAARMRVLVGAQPIAGADPA